MSRIDKIRTGLASDLVILEEQNQQNQLSDEHLNQITTVYASVYSVLTEIEVNIKKEEK